MPRYRFERFALWLMCVAVVLCVYAINVVRNAMEIDPRTNWLIILSAGTLLWFFACKFFFHPARNRYRLRTRVRRWLDRQLPLLSLA